MRYAQAVTDERAKYRQEQKAICKGRITARSADGALMTPHASVRGRASALRGRVRANHRASLP